MNPSELSENIRINPNLFPGDMGLWYDVIVRRGWSTVHCVCPYTKCQSYKEAIIYYFSTFYRKGDIPLKCEHHKFDAKTLSIMSKCC